MLETILQSLTHYYGLDWLAFGSGVGGMCMLIKGSRWGFFLNGLSSLSGFAVAAISLQFGFVIYNFLLLALMAKGFREWAPARRKSNI